MGRRLDGDEAPREALRANQKAEGKRQKCKAVADKGLSHQGVEIRASKDSSPGGGVIKLQAPEGRHHVAHGEPAVGETKPNEF